MGPFKKMIYLAILVRLTKGVALSPLLMFVVLMMTKWHIGQPLWENPHAPRVSLHTRLERMGVFWVLPARSVSSIWNDIMRCSVGKASYLCDMWTASSCLLRSVCLKMCASVVVGREERHCDGVVLKCCDTQAQEEASLLLLAIYLQYIFYIFLLYLFLFISIFYFSVNILFNFQDL